MGYNSVTVDLTAYVSQARRKETDMSKANIIRAFLDQEYRKRLSEAEPAKLAQNPTGAHELTDADLDNAAGGGKAKAHSTNLRKWVH